MKIFVFLYLLLAVDAKATYAYKPSSYKPSSYSYKPSSYTYKPSTYTSYSSYKPTTYTYTYTYTTYKPTTYTYVYTPTYYTYTYYSPNTYVYTYNSTGQGSIAGFFSVLFSICCFICIAFAVCYCIMLLPGLCSGDRYASDHYHPAASIAVHQEETNLAFPPGYSMNVPPPQFPPGFEPGSMMQRGHAFCNNGH